METASDRKQDLYSGPMFVPMVRSFHRLSSMVILASVLAMLTACSKVADDYGTAPNPTRQAEAVQSAIASAQAAQTNNAPGTMQSGTAAPPNAPMAMEGSGGASPSMNQGAPTGAPPTGLAQMLGQPPMASGSSAGGGLPPAIGAPHIYHLGGETFFLNRSSAIGLTSEQHRRLMALKEHATIAYATAQRKIDQGEQDLWVLTSSEAPDTAKIETKVGEIARLTGQQRMAFIRTVGEAVATLSDAQRKAVVSQGGPMAPAPAASGMTPGSGTPSPNGMGMGDPSRPPTGMGPSAGTPPPAMGMGHM